MRSLRSRFCWVISTFINLILGGQKPGNLTSKRIKANICQNDCTCACNILSFYLLYINWNAKNGCICCQTLRSMRGQKMAVRSIQCQNSAVRSTQVGGGVLPSLRRYAVWQKLTSSVEGSSFFLVFTCNFSGCTIACLQILKIHPHKITRCAKVQVIICIA